MHDRRIKALGTLSAYNFGAVLCCGWHGTDKLDQACKSLDLAAKARTDEANGAELAYFPLTPGKREDAPNADMVEAYEYYHTPVGSVPTRQALHRSAVLRNLPPMPPFTTSRSSSPSPYKSSQAAKRARGG
jgi:uncharacterized protein